MTTTGIQSAQNSPLALRCPRKRENELSVPSTGISFTLCFPRVSMKLRSLLRASMIVACALLLFFVNLPTTHHLRQPYLAPEFGLRDLDGNQVHLSDFRGKAVVLNFWATWCAPCRSEIPWFIEFQKEYGPRGLQIIGVSMDDGGREAIIPFIRRTGVNYIILLGDSHVSSLYEGLEVLPTTYYISPHGVVVAFANGLISKTQIDHNIKDLLGSDAQD